MFTVGLWFHLLDNVVVVLPPKLCIVGLSSSHWHIEVLWLMQDVAYFCFKSKPDLPTLLLVLLQGLCPVLLSWLVLSHLHVVAVSHMLPIKFAKIQ